MRYFLSLKLEAEPEQVSQITNILGVEPNSPPDNWSYELVVNDIENNNFVEYFMGILEGRFDKLSEIGISRDDISIWMLYEYEGECNIEFKASDLKLLGDNGISLCISCYEAGGYITFNTD
ncbi:MAG: hypothetical protein ACM3PX_11935 [Omnitrophica WOR_2 bacterium]